MTKEELLLLAGTCGKKLALIKKLKVASNKATIEEAAAHLEALLEQHNIGKYELIAAYNPRKRAIFLAKKAAALQATLPTPTPSV